LPNFSWILLSHEQRFLEKSRKCGKRRMAEAFS
jgi:hypothetical protein